jgi:tetratricopeptide (TPR) repeat protein
MAQGNPKEAADWYRAALAIEPQNQTIINNLGIALMGQNKVGQSLNAFGDAVRVDPRSDVARANLFLVSQLYLGWLGLLAIFGLNVVREAVFFNRFSLPAAGFAFFVTTVMILVLRYYKLMRMDRQTRKFHLAEVQRARRMMLPLVMIGLGATFLGISAGYFFDGLDTESAAALAAAACSAALLFGVVMPWPVAYLPWRRSGSA